MDTSSEFGTPGLISNWVTWRAKEKHKVVRQTSLAAFAVLQSKETPDLFHHQDKKNKLCFFCTTSMMQHTVHLKYNLSAIKLFLLLVSMLEHLSRFPFDPQGR
ncbi:hypothetical protein ILYODFUR_000762 [Ilyodon furcidens]|uniref:Uncharacterized protein n=1 Tax=Ilyodon furcidens TaxID=33524 RepID=A0ABV0V1X0_9TELE